MTSDNDLRRAAHINAEKLVRSEARAALREKVADAIADGWDREGSILDAADAAIDVALEEAASIPEKHARAFREEAQRCRSHSAKKTALDIAKHFDLDAAAIRAMKSSA